MLLRPLSESKPPLCISVYPEQADVKSLCDYLDLAHRYGCRGVFTNLIGLPSDALDRFKAMCAHAASKKIAVTADIDESVCAALGFSLSDMQPLLALGVTDVRLDGKFAVADIARMARENPFVNVELNASDSGGIERRLFELEPDLKNIRACHNFYPQRHTGLSLERFEKTSMEMRAQGVKVGAFVTNNEPKGRMRAWKDNEGTPTVEAMRDLDLRDQLWWMASLACVDYIVVADMYVQEWQFKHYAELRTDTMRLRVRKAEGIAAAEKAIVDYSPHKPRGDNPTETMLRSTTTRKVFKEAIGPRAGPKELAPGDVVVLNDLAGRYRGELHVMCAKIENSPSKNVVGHLEKGQTDLLSLWQEGVGFVLENA